MPPAKSQAKESPLSKPHKYPTYISFDEEELPELKEWKVGGNYTLTLEVEQVSVSKGDEYGPYDEEESAKEQSMIKGRFKVLNVETPDRKKPTKPTGGRLLNALSNRVK